MKFKACINSMTNLQPFNKFHFKTQTAGLTKWSDMMSEKLIAVLVKIYPNLPPPKKKKKKKKTCAYKFVLDTSNRPKS